MKLAPEFLQSLQGLPGFDAPEFERVHQSPAPPASIRFNPARIRQIQTTPFWEKEGPGDFFPLAGAVPWSSLGRYLTERPAYTFDPYLHAGLYYVQEASSMFLEQAFLQTRDTHQPLRVLDLCAAPGGKTTLLQGLLGPQDLLVSNEVIKSRAAILEENLVKWGAANVVVTCNDPRDFARLEGFFEVLVVDAPCSGSGLFRRDPQAMEEWSVRQVALCRQRQERILADAWPALKKGGILIYSTCSYSEQENEAVLDWMAGQWPLESLALNIRPEWGIVESRSPRAQAFGYRFYPDKTKGEGLFMAAFKKLGGTESSLEPPKKSGWETCSRGEREQASQWLNGEYFLLRQQDQIIALPLELQPDLEIIRSYLYIKKAGIRVGKSAGKDFIPDHQLALSNLLDPGIVSIELNKAEALRYLRKEDLHPDTNHLGWALISYGGLALGWAKLLPRRMNNYYPKEWRILKAG